MQKIIPRQISAQDLSNWLDNTEKPIIVDVREKQELAIALFPYDFIHLPLSDASSWIEDIPRLLPTDKPVVIICHSGVRSLNFCNWLIDQSLGYELWNLDGGIDSWSINVDESVPRY